MVKGETTRYVRKKGELGYFFPVFMVFGVVFAVMALVSGLGEGFAVDFTGFFTAAVAAVAGAGFSLTTDACAGLDGGILVVTVAFFFISLGFTLFFNSFADVFFSIEQLLFR